MRLYREILPLLAMLILAGTLPLLPAHANWPAPNTITGPILPVSHAEAINAALEALPRKRDLTVVQRKQAEDLLHDALSEDQRADAEQTKLQSFRDIPALATNTKRHNENTLSGDNSTNLAEWRAKLPAQASISQLGELLEQERNALSAAQDAIRTLDEEVQQQTQRPDALRDELARAHADVDQDTIVTERLPSAPPTLAQAARLATQATQRYQQIHLAMLEMEQRTYEERMRMLQNQRSERRSDVDERTQRVALLESLVLDRASSAVADIRTRLQQSSDQYANAPAPLHAAANANLALGEELVMAVKRLGEVRDLKARYSNQRSETEQAARNTEDRLKAGGVSEAVGLILLSERRKLQPLPALKRELSALQSELAQAKLRLVDLREEQASLRGLKPTSIQSRSGNTSPSGSLVGNDASSSDDLSHLLGTRADLLPRLIGAQSRLVTALGDTEQQLDGLVSSTAALSTTLNSRLLWTPSHAPINATWNNQFLRTTQQLFSTRHIQALRDIWHDLSAAGVGFFITLFVLLALLIFVQLRIPSLLERLATPMRRIRTDRYRCTLNALILTILAPLPLPLLFLLIGRVLQEARGSEPLDNMLGMALIALVLPLYVLAFLYWLVRESGLAHLHFRWPRARRAALQALLPSLAITVLIAQFIHTLLNLVNTDQADATFGRAVFIIAALCMSIMAWRALRSGAVWTQRGVVQNEPVRLRQLTRGVFSGIFMASGLLAIAGYYFTAFTLVERLLQSLTAMLAVWVLHGLAVRWLMLGERRLALKRMEARQTEDARNVEMNIPAGAAASTEALPEVEETELTIASLGEQTRRVLRVLVALLLTVLLLVIWSDVAPALAFLDTVSIWKVTHMIDGKEVIDFSLTLRAILLSSVVLSLTWVATRNLPGLLEIGVLRRLNVDAPTRYAITSLVRYLIVLFGVIVGIGLLGVQWANLQWLAAGLTVGLGFGLQEIFANFVSGLIVLFERPFRIGDVITVANVEGTVTRIRTRATTIVDWDNREVVVPNKTFITDRLVNWTLSDSITRIVIKIGVAYGSDPTKVQSLLLRLAHEHALVLKEPAPSCWMTGFGDSTLDFELRAFVAEIAQRNRVRTELQFRIKAAFEAAKIDIAFPQMDLWLRNAPAALVGLEATSVSPERRTPT